MSHFHVSGRRISLWGETKAPAPLGPFRRNDPPALKLENHQKVCHAGKFDESCRACADLKREVDALK